MKQGAITAEGEALGPVAEPKRRKKGLRLAIMLALPLAIAAVGLYLWLGSGRYVTTDNAYVQQDKASVSAEITGTISEVAVRENQHVRKGDLLFRIDPRPYRIALEQAEAQIAEARVQVSKLQAETLGTGEDVAAAEANLQFAQRAFARQDELLKRGFTTRARYDEAQHAVQEARDRLASSRANVQIKRSALAQGPLTEQPAYAAAIAARDKALLDLKRTEVRAPIDGYVSQTERLQVGNAVVTGLPMVTIVRSDDSWVEANYKETQLTRMAPGQPVEIQLDAYPSTKIRGHVMSIGRGTGSEFSVLPAQNATGNWVKVTQRVPVRIAIDSNPGRPLLAGLSAHVKVDTQEVPPSAAAARPSPAAASSPVAAEGWMIPAGEARIQLGRTEHAIVTVALMMAVLLQVLDTTIANVALRHMMASMSATPETINWVLTSYIVASAIAIPITGWLSDRIGRRFLFIASVIGFTAASVLCAIAQNLPEMVAFRAIQGVSGAFLVPIAQAVMFDINPPRKHPQAMAMFGMGVMIGPIAGPVLGGWLTDNFNWRWVFLVNLPVGILAALVLLRYMPRFETARRRFDLFGFALLALALGALQMMLDRGEQLDWFDSWEVWIEGGLALSGFWIFAIHLATAREPLFDLRMFKDRNFAFSLLFMAVTGVLLLAGLALLPPLLQRLYGYSVLQSGYLTTPRGVGTLISMMVAGKITGRVDSRLLIFIGIGLMALSLYQMSGFTLEMSSGPIIVSGLVQGFGLGMIFVPLQSLAFASLPAEFRTTGAALLNLARNIGGAIGISMVTTLLARNVQVSHSDLAAHITSSNLPPMDPSVVSRFGALGDSAAAMIDAEINRQALMIAYLDDFHAMMLVTLAAMPLVWLLRRANKAGGGPPVMAD